MRADPSVPSAFPAYCQLMLLYGDMCDFVNNVKGQWHTAAPPDPPTSSQAGSTDDSASELIPPMHQAANVRSLEPLEDAIADVYAKLPPLLRWSSLKCVPLVLRRQVSVQSTERLLLCSFRKHHDAGLGPMFLHLHLWVRCGLVSPLIELVADVRRGKCQVQLHRYPAAQSTTHLSANQGGKHVACGPSQRRHPLLLADLAGDRYR